MTTAAKTASDHESVADETKDPLRARAMARIRTAAVERVACEVTAEECAALSAPVPEPQGWEEIVRLVDDYGRRCAMNGWANEQRRRAALLRALRASVSGAPRGNWIERTAALGAALVARALSESAPGVSDLPASEWKAAWASLRRSYGVALDALASARSERDEARAAIDYAMSERHAMEAERDAALLLLAAERAEGLATAATALVHRLSARALERAVMDCAPEEWRALRDALAAYRGSAK